MNRILFFIALAYWGVIACKPALKEEPAKLPPPTKPISDTILVPKLTRLWNTEAKLKTSESVLYDSSANLLYVSCIGNVPADKKDGDGFIAKVGLDGKIIQLKWVSGLNAPKGMGKVNNTLYVADIDKLVAIDVKTGKISNSWKVLGASFLNDIATSPQGIVYISDSDKNKVFQLAKGKVQIMFSDTTMNGSNGVFFDGEKLLIAGGGNTFALDLANNKLEKFAEGIPNGDGIERYQEGIVQSNWNGEIYFIDANRKITKILDTKNIKLNSADIKIVENKNLLFVPTFFGNSVTAYSISFKN